MAARKTLDQQPGPLPEIHIKDDSVIFEFRLREILEGSRFIVRCDARGGVWASIDPLSSVSSVSSLFTAGD